MGISEEDRSILGLIYGITAACSLFMNLLILLVLYKENRYYKKFPFYSFSRHMIFCDSLKCLIELILTVPATIYSYNIYIVNSTLLSTSTWLTKIEALPQKGVIVFLLIASLHRLFLFVYPQLEAYCFREYASIIWRLLGWLYIILNTLSAGFVGCTRVFSYESYYYYWICESTALAQFYPQMIQMENYISLMVVLFILITIYFHAKILKKSIQYNKKGFHEKNVLRQVFFICLTLLFYKISIAIFESTLPVNQEPSKRLIFVENLLEILISNVHPISYLLFNRKVRNHLQKSICSKNRGSGKFQRNSRYNSPVPPPVNYVSYEQLCQTPPLKPPAASRILRNRQQAKLISTRSV